MHRRALLASVVSSPCLSGCLAGAPRASDRSGPGHRQRGESSPRGLWLHHADDVDHLDREGTRWQPRTDGERGDCRRGYAAYGCGPRRYDSGESLANEYVVWADECVDSYMSPGTYRWEEPVRIYEPSAALDDDPTATFDWGFSLRVEKP